VVVCVCLWVYVHDIYIIIKLLWNLWPISLCWYQGWSGYCRRGSSICEPRKVTVKSTCQAGSKLHPTSHPWSNITYIVPSLYHLIDFSLLKKMLNKSSFLNWFLKVSLLIFLSVRCKGRICYNLGKMSLYS